MAIVEQISSTRLVEELRDHTFGATEEPPTSDYLLTTELETDERVPDTQLWIIESKLTEHKEWEARATLQQWSQRLISSQTKGDIPAHLEDFQQAMSIVLDGTDTIPTDAVLTKPVAELLTDPKIKMRYITRMLGEEWSDKEQRWLDPSVDNWTPVSSELGWLIEQRLTATNLNSKFTAAVDRAIEKRPNLLRELVFALIKQAQIAEIAAQ